MIESQHEFRLFVEQIALSGALPTDATQLPVLAFETADACALVQEGDRFAFAKIADSSEAHHRQLQLEPITLRGRAALAMTTPTASHVRVNGTPAGCLCVLEVGDQIQLETHVLHVSLYRRACAIRAPRELIGAVCAVCSVPIDEDATIVVHDCGAPLHLEPASTPEERRLECARLGCHSCEKPVALEAGYAFVPELELGS